MVPALIILSPAGAWAYWKLVPHTIKKMIKVPYTTKEKVLDSEETVPYSYTMTYLETQSSTFHSYRHEEYGETIEYSFTNRKLDGYGPKMVPYTLELKPVTKTVQWNDHVIADFEATHSYDDNAYAGTIRREICIYCGGETRTIGYWDNEVGRVQRELTYTVPSLEFQPNFATYTTHEVVVTATEDVHRERLVTSFKDSIPITLKKAGLVYDPVEYTQHHVRSVREQGSYTCRTYRWAEVTKYRWEEQEVTVYEPLWVPDPDKKTPTKRAGLGGSSGPGGPDYDDLIREIELRDRINDELRSLIFDDSGFHDLFDLEHPSDWSFDFDFFGPEPLEQLRVDPNSVPPDYVIPPHLQDRPPLPSRVSPLQYMESLLKEFTNWLEANLLMDDEEYQEYKKAVENAFDAAKKAEGVSGSTGRSRNQPKKRRSANQMEMDRSKKKRGVTHVDKGNEATHTKDHVHFEDGSALNYDGTIHHRTKDGKPPRPTKRQQEWLEENGWAPWPIEE